MLAICSLYLLLHDARSKKDLNKVIIFADVRFMYPEDISFSYKEIEDEILFKCEIYCRPVGRIRSLQ